MSLNELSGKKNPLPKIILVLGVIGIIITGLIISAFIFLLVVNSIDGDTPNSKAAIICSNNQVVDDVSKCPATITLPPTTSSSIKQTTTTLMRFFTTSTTIRVTTTMPVVTTTLVKSTTTTTIQNFTCSTSMECGDNREEKICKDGDVYLVSISYQCVKPATIDSKCVEKSKFVGSSMWSPPSPFTTCKHGCVDGECVQA